MKYCTLPLYPFSCKNDYFTYRAEPKNSETGKVCIDNNDFLIFSNLVKNYH